MSTAGKEEHQGYNQDKTLSNNTFWSSSNQCLFSSMAAVHC